MRIIACSKPLALTRQLEERVNTNFFNDTEIRLKFSTLLTLAALFTTPYAFADCKTVMGGCTKEEAVNVAPHMRSSATAPTTISKPVAPVANQNIKNANVSGAQTSKAATSKKM